MSFSSPFSNVCNSIYRRTFRPLGRTGIFADCKKCRNANRRGNEEGATTSKFSVFNQLTVAAAAARLDMIWLCFPWADAHGYALLPLRGFQISGRALLSRSHSTVGLALELASNRSRK
jgi:hypothetical protein